MVAVATARVSQRAGALLNALLAKTKTGVLNWSPSDLEGTYVAANSSFTFVADEFTISVNDHCSDLSPVVLRWPSGRAGELLTEIREAHRDREGVIQRAIVSLG